MLMDTSPREFINQYPLLSAIIGIFFFVLIVGWLFRAPPTYFKQIGGTSPDPFQDYVSNTGLLPDGKYVIRGSRNQRFCRDDPNGLICNTDFPGPDEVFTVQKLDGELYAIKGGRGENWCTLTTTGLRCESPVVGDWEAFKIHPMGGNRYGIQSNRNKKWCIDSGHGMVCDVPSMNGWDFQQFEFIPIRHNNIK